MHRYYYYSIDASLSKMIARDVKNNKLTADEGKLYHGTVMSRIITTTNIAEAHNCDIIIEAIIEDKQIKLDFYKHIGPLIKPSAIFASNTSSLLITEMALVS